MREIQLQFARIFLLAISIQACHGRRVPSQTGNNAAVCHTKSCKDIAEYILHGLDPTKDPCDDFYEFTCGQWQTTNPSPRGQEQWSRIHVLVSQIKQRFIDILKAKDEINATEPLKLMRKDFRDCMDLNELNRIGIEPIDSILKKFGDWPLLRNNSRATINWQKLDQHYSELTGTYSLFDINVETIMVKSSTNPIKISTPQLPRSDLFPINMRWGNFLRTKKLLVPYVHFIKGIAKAFFEHRKISYSEEKVNSDIMKMLVFEANLYLAQKDAEGARNIKTIKQLQNHYDNSLPVRHNKTADINWLKSITDIFKFMNVPITENEEIYILEWKYISKLAQLLDQIPNDVIVNYIHWNFIATTILFTNGDTRRLVRTVWRGGMEQRPREEECQDECQFRPVMYYEYAKKYFTASAKEKALQMAEKLRKKTLDDIGKTNWLDEITRSISLRKIQRIHMMIGYPDWYSDKAITEHYKDMKRGATYVEKMISSMQFSRLVELKKFRQPVSKYVWVAEPDEPNAMYVLPHNEIIMTMAIIQAHDCCDDLPRAIRYGLDGFILGHEIFHSLDTRGIQANEHGRRFTLPTQTEQNYVDKLNCFSHEYHGLKFVGKDPQTKAQISIKANATVSVRENIADIAGIRVSFETYREESNKNDLRLPGLENYDSDKLFFITFASRLCTTGTTNWWKATFEEGNYDGGHSPARLRVNNPLKIFDEFATAFNCKATDKMNSPSKCKLFK